MEKDRRIKLLINGINRGTLYTKTRAILNAKGKYVMTLDHSNLSSIENVFSTLYEEAEYYNLDLLGFSTIGIGVKIKKIPTSNFLNYFKTKVIKNPYLKKRFLGFDKSIRNGIYLYLYFIKTGLFINLIKKLGDEFINRYRDPHDDTILILILTRNALTLKHLKELFYIILTWPTEYIGSLKFQRAVKRRERKRKNCYSYLTFIEVLILFTENNDKYIAEYCLYIWFLNHEKYKNNTEVRNDAIKVCNLFLNN